MKCSMSDFPVPHHLPKLPKFMSSASLMPSNHLILCYFFCLQSFSASGFFPVSQLFASGGQNIDASASVLPMSIQDWFPLILTSLTSLLSKGLSRVISSTEVQKWEEIGIWTKIIIVVIHQSLQTGAQVFREVKKLTPGHTACLWQSQGQAHSLPRVKIVFSFTPHRG